MASSTGYVDQGFQVTYGARVAPNTLSYPLGESFGVGISVPCVLTWLPTNIAIFTQELLDVLSVGKAMHASTISTELAGWMKLSESALGFWDNIEDAVWDDV